MMRIVEWQKPITNRSNFDVQYARNYISECIRTGKAMTEHLKGCLNYSDLNRIENNTLFIVNVYEKLGIKMDVNKRSSLWTQYDILTTVEIERIIGNISQIVAPTIPENERESFVIPATITIIEHINRLELLLERVRIKLIDARIGFKLTNTFAAGQEKILPLNLGSDK